MISRSDLHKCRKFFTGLPCHKKYQTPFFLIKQKSEGEVLRAFSSHSQNCRLILTLQWIKNCPKKFGRNKAEK